MGPPINPQAEEKLRISESLQRYGVSWVSRWGMAWAHDGDDYSYRHDEAREHGYQNGYRDGIDHGRYDRMQGYRNNYKSDQWEDADGGYQQWMGSRGRYK